MPDMHTLLQMQAELFCLMGLGFFFRRAGLIPASGRKLLTTLVVDLFLPANIVHSFLIELSGDALRQGVYVLAVSIIIQLICALFGQLLYPGVTPAQRAVLKYGTICSNAGFIGNPVVEGLYGSQGLMLASLYLIPQRIVMWSGGLACFTPAKGREVVKKVLTHPCIIACAVGLVLMVTGLPLPGFVDRTLVACANCNTAMSMLLIGVILGEINLKSLFSGLSVYYCFVRLVLIPLLVLGGCLLAGLPSLSTGVCVVLAGMPAGATAAMLAEQYDGDAALAARIIFLSTVGSVVTIPLLCMLMQVLA